jgi:hypothetical protein
MCSKCTRLVIYYFIVSLYMVKTYYKIPYQLYTNHRNIRRNTFCDEERVVKYGTKN